MRINSYQGEPGIILYSNLHPYRTYSEARPYEVATPASSPCPKWRSIAAPRAVRSCGRKLLPALIPWWKNSVLNWDCCPGKKNFLLNNSGGEPNYNIFRSGWPPVICHATYGGKTKREQNKRGYETDTERILKFFESKPGPYFVRDLP